MCSIAASAPRSARNGRLPSRPPRLEPVLHVTLADGSRRPLDKARLELIVEEACAGLDGVSTEPVLTEAHRNLYDGIGEDELSLALIMAARTLVEQEPNFAYVSARLLLDKLRREVLSFVHGAPTLASQAQMGERYRDYFPAYVRTGIDAGLLDPELARFDLARIAAALKPERDLKFQFLGLQTLYDRYFLHVRGNRIELPQAFFMRVAMGLALREIDREAKAIEFYGLLSSFDFMASTPTLFNAGTQRPQLSSCFLTTVADDLDGIFKSIKDNALLAKYSGGLGNDWTPVRGLGAHIKGTNGESQGVVPFLKVANDTAIAVNQGGKRKGAVCAYLETWHVDIEEFLDLRKNTGDDRRRTHDMNTANWVPDLFMQRVVQDGEWTLFSPDETADLHDLYGPAFQAAYEAYEAKAARGEMQVFKKVRATDLWRRMLTMLFETGHPWITFKDPCNLRSPQQHVGVVHSSNLCTEITLNTSADEVAVCNLGSVNLLNHVGAGRHRPGPAEAHRDGGVAHARQRHRHQFLHHPRGAALQPAAPPGRPRPDGLSGGAARAADRDRVRCRGGVRRSQHGGDFLPRHRSLVRSRRRARPLSELCRLALVERHPADRFAAASCGRARRSRPRPLRDAGLGPVAQEGDRDRHAQLQRDGDRADGDDLQHLRRRRNRSSRTTRTCSSNRTCRATSPS